MAGIIKVDRVQSDSNLAFQVAGANVAYMNSTGLQMTGGTLSLNGTTIIPAVGQIAFPAAQSSSSDANTLDDYEEGTFTPSIRGSASNPTITYNTQVGSYTKIGRLVFIQIDLEWSNSSGGSGTPEIVLPFSCGGSYYYEASVGLAQGFTYTGYNQFASQIYGGQNFMSLVIGGTGQTGTGGPMPGSGGGYLRHSFCYHTA